MRNVFGWSLPPGCTHRMIDEAMGVDQPCAVCCCDVADCCCPECSECGEQGNPKCYERYLGEGQGGHGLKLNKEQALSRQRAVIHQVKLRVQDEEMAYSAMEEGSTTEWYLNELPDPWR
jgi:hypothetical protein